MESVHIMGVPPRNSIKWSPVTTAQLPTPATSDNKNKRPGERSTFDQPPVSVKAKCLSDGKPSRKFIDWVAIHQREFDKMDSLDVYLKKREERRRRLQTPVKVKVEKSLTKPMVFAPSILLTKQMNTNFSTMFKSPSAVAAGMAAKRPAFDLKASLSRPLTWTPHCGKLKPFSVAGEDVKTYKPKTRDQRRDEAHAKHHMQRQADHMQRRLRTVSSSRQ